MIIVLFFLNETLISILCLESRYKYSLKTIAFINRSHSSLEEHYSLDEYYSTIPAIRVRVRALPKKENFFFINWGLTLYVVHNKDWQVKGPYHVQVPKHRIISIVHPWRWHWGCVDYGNYHMLSGWPCLDYGKYPRPRVYT